MKLLMIKKSFQIYYDFSEKVSKMQGYRILALNRGEKLGILKVGFDHNTDKMIRFMASRFKNRNAYIDDVISKNYQGKKSFLLWNAVFTVN